MTSGADSPRLLAALSGLARSMTAGASVQEILDRVVGAIVEVMPVSGAGATLLDANLLPRVVAASDETALLGEHLQSELQEGPCLVAHHSRTPCVIGDLACELRFPRFRSAATAAGMRAVFAFPLVSENTSLGAIDVYRRTAGDLTPEDAQTAQTISDIVATFLINARRRTELEEFVGQLQTVSHRDPLTGLPNRMLLMERLEQAFAREERSVGVVAALFIDLDGFKAINDQYGHGVGDDVLVAVAHRIGAVLRPADTLARLGGDEFVIVCEDLEDDRAIERLATRITTRLQEPFDVPGGTLHIGASLGSALSGPACQTPLELLRDADAAMYAIKRAGGPHPHHQVSGTRSLRWPPRPGTPDVSWAEEMTGAEASEEWWIDGPTPHGGVIASVVWDAADDELVITEFGRAAMVVCRHEWSRRARDPGRGDGHTVELIVVDWDEQIVARQIVARMPAAPRSPLTLVELLGALKTVTPLARRAP